MQKHDHPPHAAIIDRVHIAQHPNTTSIWCNFLHHEHAETHPSVFAVTRSQRCNALPTLQHAPIAALRNHGNAPHLKLSDRRHVSSAPS